MLRLRDSAISAAISELVKTNPEEITQRLEELKEISGVSDDNLNWTLVTSWSEYDPLKTINWIQEATVTGSRLQGNMLSQALQRLIQIDQDKAWDIALKQPRDSYFVKDGQIGNLLSELVDEGYLDTAINLLDDLPEAAIYSGFRAVARRLIEVDRWSEALNLADNLETDYWESYLRSITTIASHRNVQSLIDQLKEMPDNETRKYMADELVRLNDFRGDVLTEQQLEVVQSLLPTEDQNSELNNTESFCVVNALVLERIPFHFDSVLTHFRGTTMYEGVPLSESKWSLGYSQFFTLREVRQGGI